MLSPTKVLRRPRTLSLVSFGRDEQPPNAEEDHHGVVRPGERCGYLGAIPLHHFFSSPAHTE